MGLLASPAGALTFGADLNQPANNEITCAQAGASTCALVSGAPGPLFYAPATGIVTRVRVKSAQGGRMQVIVMRSLLQNNAAEPGRPFQACCFVQQYGPTFSAAPGITEVPATLPMRADPPPPFGEFTTNAAGDFLVLAMLEGDKPFPAFVDGVSVMQGFFPAPTDGNPPAPSPNPILPGTAIGRQVLMNADLEGASSPSPTPVAPGLAPGPGPAGTVQPVGFGAGGGGLAGRTASVPLACELDRTCAGILRLLSRAPAGAAARKVRVYGRARFRIPAGRSRRVKVKVGRGVPRGKRLRVYADARIPGQPAVGARITLARWAPRSVRPGGDDARAEEFARAPRMWPRTGSPARSRTELLWPRSSPSRTRRAASPRRRRP